MNRKQKRRIKRIVLNLLFLLILAGGGVVVFMWMNEGNPSPKKLICGEYRSSADISDEAAEASRAWLSGAVMGAEIEIPVKDGDIGIELKLTVSKDGTYAVSVNEESVEAAAAKAREALCEAFLDLAVKRLKAGGAGDYDKESARQRTEEKLGMTLEDYMISYGPGLVGEAGEYKERYEKSGSWKLEKGVLYLDGTAADGFSAGKDMLVVSPVKEDIRVWTRIK